MLLLQPWPQLFPQTWAHWSTQLQAVSSVLVLATVGMCLVRGLPVIVEFVVGHKVFAVRPHLSTGSR